MRIDQHKLRNKVRFAQKYGLLHATGLSLYDKFLAMGLLL